MPELPKLQSARLEFEGRIAVLSMARDDVRNELTGSGLVDDICATIDWANGTSDVAVLVLTGEGRAFSAGGNIKDMQARSGAFAGDVAEVAERYGTGIQRIPLAMYGAEVPIIGAVNGAAIGAGCDLACMCDLTIAAESARFGATFINLGIVPGDGGAWFLQRLVGHQKAAEMLLTGKLLTANEAKESGLVLDVVPDEDLMDRALELAQEMASKPPQALRYTIRLMKRAQRMELHDFLDLCAVYQGICHNSEDHLEAVNAFLEKRPARFGGR